MEGLGAPHPESFSARASDSATGGQSIHGFDRTLTLVATRREDYEMDDIMEIEVDGTHS